MDQQSSESPVAAGDSPAVSPELNGATAPEARNAQPGSPSVDATPGPQANGTPPAPPTRVERAEHVVDGVAAWVGNFTSVWGRRALRLGSRIREEAEDFWAEAQSIRRGDKP